MASYYTKEFNQRLVIINVVNQALSLGASKRGQDKRYFCRSAAIYHDFACLFKRNNIYVKIMGIYGTSAKKTFVLTPFGSR